MKKRYGAIWLLILLLLSGCSLMNDHGNAHPLEYDTCSKYHRDLLSEEQQADYDILYEGLYYYDESIELQSYEDDDIFTIFSAVNLDHPELFWVDYEYWYLQTQGIKKRAYIKPEYEIAKQDIAGKLEELETIVTPILEEARQKDSDYEKVRFVYDYIVDHCEYLDKEENNQNMLSVFLDEKAVCAGYAKALKYLFDQLGMENMILAVHDWQDQEVGHVINAVKMDGEYYYLDATYGDADIGKEYLEYRYTYFAMTSEEMLRIYQPDEEYIETEAVSDNYFYRHGFYLNTYQESDIVRIIQENMLQGNETIAIKCRNEDTFKQMYLTMESQVIFSIFEQAGFSRYAFSYCVDDRMYCIFIQM